MSALQVVITQIPDYGDALGTRSKDSSGTPATEAIEHNEEDLGIDLRRSDSMPETSPIVLRERNSTPPTASTTTASTGEVPGNRSLSANQQSGQSDVPYSSHQVATSTSVPRRLDKFGFIVNVDSRGHVYDDSLDGHSDAAADYVPSFAQAKLTARRERKWKQTMNSWERRRPKVTVRRLRKGVPDSLRGRVWVKLGGGIKKKGLYDSIVRKTANVILETSSSNISCSASVSSASPNNTAMSNQQSQPGDRESVDRNDATVDPYIHSKAFRDIQNTIERDIHRTFPRHDLFYEDERSEDLGRVASSPSSADTPENSLLHGLCDPELTALISGMDREMKISPSEGLDLSTRATAIVPSCPSGQAALRRVLRAYSYYDREVGYCQGMNFIVGMFLTLMSEEEAFWLLISVMNNEPCNMRGLFGEGMKETHKVLHVSEMLIKQFLPRLSKHFDREHIHVTMYATQWLLTQYTSSFKFDLVTRVWDCFLGEGWKVIYRVMLALLQQHQSQLLKMSFEEILTFFRDFPNRVDGATIMDTALRIPLRKKHIAKYEKEWLYQQRQQERA